MYTAQEKAGERKGSKERRKRVLRSQVIIDEAHKARPVIRPKLGKRQQRSTPSAATVAPTEGPTRPKLSPVYDVWSTVGEQPREEEDFEAVAKAVAAKQRTPFGIVRPAKRRYSSVQPSHL
jgi:hypothetical protein